MTNVYAEIQRFMQDQQGVTTIEYALVAALIAVALVASLKDVTAAIKGTFATIVTNLSGA